MGLFGKMFKRSDELKVIVHSASAYPESIQDYIIQETNLILVSLPL